MRHSLLRTADRHDLLVLQGNGKTTQVEFPDRMEKKRTVRQRVLVILRILRGFTDRLNDMGRGRKVRGADRQIVDRAALLLELSFFFVQDGEDPCLEGLGAF